MESNNNDWRCVEGSVDQAAEHFRIVYGDEGTLMARVAQGADKTFVVEYESRPTPGGDSQQALDAVRREIEFYLLEVGGPDPWAYAIYHCGTTANVYSKVHWGYVPGRSDRKGEAVPRKMVIETSEGEHTLLSETLAESEEQLQELVKENPDLIPVEEFGMSGPVMVVGRETGLASGAVDLVVLTRGGDLLIIEFKTGPQNSDFRAALAQLLDYGADVWQMTLEEFEQAVAIRYFASDRCRDRLVKGKRSLVEAARATWDGIGDDELAALRERLTRQLSEGSMHYVLVAQRFTPTMVTTMHYLNTITPTVNFWAVELVRFTGERMSAFETRTLLKPRKSNGSSPARIDEEKLLEKINDGTYRDSILEMLEAFRGFDLRLEWGASGVSIRLPTPDRAEPLTVAWFFPPEVPGWMGLKDLTLGVGTGLDEVPSVRPALEVYLKEAEQLDGAQPTNAAKLTAFHLPPAIVVALKANIIELVGELVRSAGETTP